MKYWYDTEFIEDGRTIELVSIGIVAEDGREFYRESNEVDWSKANNFVLEHVKPWLNGLEPILASRAKIRQDLTDFFADDPHIELWSWCAAFDHIALCQIWGSMGDQPHWLPWFTHELEQIRKGGTPKHDGTQHNALEDAHFHKKLWHYWSD